jgi:nicotinamidase-related amidase
LPGVPGSLSVDASPWSWPVTGPAAPETVALLVIDMQHDFVDDDGWFARMGLDVKLVQAAVPVVGAVLEAARAAGVTVVHTRQGNAPDLSDLPAARLEQGRRNGHPIGVDGPLGRGLIRGEPGFAIVPELAPVAGELVVDKTAHSAFWGTDLDARLAALGVQNLVICGVTTNVCVLSTLYSAVDRGFSCLLVTDAVAAVSVETNESVLDLVRYQGGLLGCLADSGATIAGLTLDL